MSYSHQSPTRFRWVALYCMLPAVAILLIIGVWTETRWGAIAVWVTTPVIFGLVIGLLGGRKSEAAEGPYQITSQGARSEAQLTLSVPKEQVMTVVEDAVKELPRFTLVRISSSEAQLTARMNIKAWGAHIGLQFNPIAFDETKIEALWEPRLKTTMVDYGQGAKDLRKLLDSITLRAQKTNR